LHEASGVNIQQQSGTAEVTSDTLSNKSADIIANTIEGIMPYEMYREPLFPILDDSKTTLPVRNLNQELQCPVCLGIIHKTCTVMECLHRFCKACITKALRTGRKECPTCRVKITSKRHMRLDPNFDALILKIYPNLSEYEAKQDIVIAEITKSIKLQNLSKTVKDGLARQAKAKNESRRRSEIDDEKDDDIYSIPELPPVKQPKVNGDKKFKKRKSDKIENETTQIVEVLKENSDNKDKATDLLYLTLEAAEGCTLPPLERKYIRAPPQATTSALKKLLQRRLNHKSLTLYLNVKGKSIELKEDNSLQEVQQKYKQDLGKGDLIVIYSDIA